VKRFVRCAVALAATVALAGCGQSPPASPVAGQGQADGALRISVEFPDASARLVPQATQSVRVGVESKATGALLAERLLTPASPSTTITKLIVARSAPSARQPIPERRAGTPLAAAAVDVTIPEGVALPVNLVMASTIESVTITPGTAKVLAGGTAALTATARDSSARVVLTSAWQWATDDPAVAEVDDTGVLTAHGPGSTAVHATESESLLSARTDVAVAEISVTPTSHDFRIGETHVDVALSIIGPASVDWTAATGLGWATASLRAARARRRSG